MIYTWCSMKDQTRKSLGQGNERRRLLHLVMLARHHRLKGLLELHLPTGEGNVRYGSTETWPGRKEVTTSLGVIKDLRVRAASEGAKNTLGGERLVHRVTH